MNNDLSVKNAPTSEPSLDTDIQIAQKLWSQIIEVITPRITIQSLKTWFDPITPVRFSDKILYLQVPSQFFSEWIEEHYQSLLYETMKTLLGDQSLDIEYIVAPDNLPLSLESELVVSSPLGERSSSSLFASKAIPVQLPGLLPTLNPRYMFGNYIKGESNQFARAAAQAVANNPGGTSFNPLVIYGGVGLGKTHLVHAIGNHLLTTARP